LRTFASLASNDVIDARGSVLSIYRNVAYGLALNRYRGDREERVEQALRGGVLWDEVKDKLHQSALTLSGGQQQRLRLCIHGGHDGWKQVCQALCPPFTRKRS